MSNHFIPREYANTQFGRPIAVMQDPKRDTPKARANAEALERAKAENPAFPALALAMRERLRTEPRFRKQNSGVTPKASEAMDAAQARRQANYAATVARIEQIMPCGPITSTELAEITGLSKSTIRRALMDLIDAGKVVSIAKGRGHMAYMLAEQLDVAQ